MLIVETVSKLRRLAHVQGKAIKAICRELGVSRKVVRNQTATSPDFPSHFSVPQLTICPKLFKQPEPLLITQNRQSEIKIGCGIRNRILQTPRPKSVFYVVDIVPHRGDTLTHIEVTQLLF